MPFLTQGPEGDKSPYGVNKTNWKYILIILILALIVGGGIFLFTIRQITPVTQLLVVKKSDKEGKTETLEGVEGLNLETTKLDTINSKIFQPMIVFSPNGRKIAYNSKDGNKYFVIVNGISEKKYDGMDRFINNNVKELGNWNGIIEFIFSPDSQKLAYIASENNRRLLVVNGKEEKKYDDIEWGITFSPDSQKIAYVAKEENKYFVVVNNREGNKYKMVWWEPIFSSNGQNMAYVAEDGGNYFVVLNGQEERKHDWFQGVPVFSPDNQKLVYVAQDGDKKFIITKDLKSGKDTETEIYWDVHGIPYQRDTTITFSPDSQKIAYVAKEENNEFIIINGQSEKKYEKIRTRPVFSPDSQKLAYIASENNRRLLVVNGKEEIIRDKILGNIVFSPDSQKLAYIAQSSAKNYFLIVDDQKEKKYKDCDKQITDPIFSPDNESIAYGTMIGKEIWWMVEKIQDLKLKTPEKLEEINFDPSITKNWKTYRNEDYGFEITYPEDAKVFSYEPNPICFFEIELPVIEKGTSLISKSLCIYAFLNTEDWYGGQVKIGNTEFSKETFKECGMQNCYEYTNYTTVKDNKYIRFRPKLHTSKWGFRERLKDYNKEKEAEIFNQILSTFTLY